MWSVHFVLVFNIPSRASNVSSLSSTNFVSFEHQVLLIITSSCPLSQIENFLSVMEKDVATEGNVSPIIA